jgi:glycosyltransferase involved in cell wall biosynthesis
MECNETKDFLFKKNIIFITLILLIYLKIFEEKEKKYIKSSITPKVSVFLPIFNRGKYLFMSIKSITNQALKNIEIIAVNDASTDNTLKILKKLSKKDKRIRIINNNRNHGTLYSRAIGIINCRGEYLMNLDPDDKFKSNSDLKFLYNKAKKSNLDYILFLIKRVPRYKSELKSLDLLNKLQLENEDFLITNKIIKREVLVKAINYFYNDIIKYKWIYHDDNIWNILTRMYGQTSKIVKKYIYIYKRNNDSANIKKNNFFEVKNRIYRLMSLIKIIKNSQVNDSYLYYDNYYKSYINIYKAYDNSILRPSEIKNNLINISFSFLDIYKNNKATIDEINVIMNSISQNKIIIFYNSLENNIIDYLTYVSIKKYLQENTLRKIISININDNTQLNNTFKYIYSNDILIGLGNLIFHYNFIQLINNFNKNKIILLYNNFINNSNKYNISSNLFIYSFKRNYNKKITNNFLYIPNNIINLANYFNNIRYFENINNNLTVFFNNYTIEDIGRINYF